MEKIGFTINERENFIKAIRNFFYKELDQDIGELKAILVLDFFIENIGLDIYNKGVEDSHSYLEDKINDLYEIKLYKK